jgi:anti-sigma-K factor RskA
MNLLAHPHLLDQLAAGYALGSLRGAARRRFETLARAHPRVRASVLVWQERLAGITELQLGQAPAPYVWTRIQNDLAAQRWLAESTRRAPAAATESDIARRLRRALGWWRGAALAGAFATVAAIGIGLAVQREAGRDAGADYVAVLADDKAAPAMLVTFEPARQTLVLRRVGSFRERPDQSLQLWALPSGGSARSLGVLGEGQIVRLPTPESQLREVPALAISVERQGGVPAASGPQGPVVFKGALLRTVL